MTWPYPRLIQTKWRTFLITQTGLLINLVWAMAEYWIKQPLFSLGDVSLISSIDIADFGPFYVVCLSNKDGSSRMISNYPNTGVLEETENVCGIGLAFNGQFIGAHERQVLWTAIGNFDFRPETDRTAGFRSLFIPPAGGNPRILKLMQLGTTVVAYANNGRIVLQPNIVGNTFAYGEQLSYGLGVKSGNHVSGDARIHGYIDLAGDFWVHEEGQAIDKRGYREFIKEMSLDDIIVSFLPVDKSFYICDGVRCLVINEFGANHINVLSSGIMYRWDGTIVASGMDTLDEEARITTEWVDYKSRGLKSVESLVASMNTPNVEDVWLTVDYRMKKNQPFTRFRWITGGPQVESAIHVAALDFRLAMRSASFRGVEIDSIMSNVKYSDQRFKRGTVPAQYST